MISIKLPSPAADKSLAIPLIPKQSGLFGVTEISTIFSSFSLKKLLPTSLEFFFKSIIPALSFDIFNSLSEHNIPKDSTPLIFAILSFNFDFGITAPGEACTVYKSGLTLSAPQTTFLISSFETRTSQIFNLSAFGCFSTFITFAILNNSEALFAFFMFSTSRPILVNLSIILFKFAGVFKCFFNQDRVNIIC